MVRMIPSEVDPLIYPAVSLSLLAAWIAATVAIIAALCGTKSRKSPPEDSSPSSSPKTEHNNTQVETTTTTAAEPPQSSPLETTTTAAAAVATAAGEQEQGPVSPSHQQQQQHQEDRLHRRTATNIPISNFVPSKETLIKSLSVRIPGSGAVARYRARKEEQQQQKEEKWKPEESIWTKTIILGEKCKVPDEEDAIIYDGKGNRIAAYPTRATPRSLPVSRTNSFFNPPEVIPS